MFKLTLEGRLFEVGLKKDFGRKTLGSRFEEDYGSKE